MHVNAKQAAKMLNISVVEVHVLIREKKLKATKLGKSYHINYDDVAQLAKDLKRKDNK